MLENKIEKNSNGNLEKETKKLRGKKNEILTEASLEEIDDQFSKHAEHLDEDQRKHVGEIIETIIKEESQPNLFEKFKIVEEIPESTSKDQASNEGLENKEKGEVIETITKDESEELVEETTAIDKDLALDAMAKRVVPDEEGLEQKENNKTLTKTIQEVFELLVEKPIFIANCCTIESSEFTTKTEVIAEQKEMHTMCSIEATAKCGVQSEDLLHKENVAFIETKEVEDHEEDLNLEITAKIYDQEERKEETKEQEGIDKILEITTKEEDKILVEESTIVENDVTLEPISKNEISDFVPKENCTIVERAKKEEIEPVMDIMTMNIDKEKIAESLGKSEVPDKNFAEKEIDEITEKTIKGNFRQEEKHQLLEITSNGKSDSLVEEPAVFEKFILDVTLISKERSKVHEKEIMKTSTKVGTTHVVEEPKINKEDMTLETTTRTVVQEEKEKRATQPEENDTIIEVLPKEEPLVEGPTCDTIVINELEAKNEVQEKDPAHREEDEIVEQEPPKRLNEESLQRATKIEEISHCDSSYQIEHSLTVPTLVKIFESSIKDFNQQMMSPKKVSNDTQATVWVFESERLDEGNELGELETPGDMTKQHMTKVMNDKSLNVPNEMKFPVVEIDNNNFCKEFLNDSFNIKPEELNPPEVTDSNQDQVKIECIEVPLSVSANSELSFRNEKPCEGHTDNSNEDTNILHQLEEDILLQACNDLTADTNNKEMIKKAVDNTETPNTQYQDLQEDLPTQNSLSCLLFTEEESMLKNKIEKNANANLEEETEKLREEQTEMLTKASLEEIDDQVSKQAQHQDGDQRKHVEEIIETIIKEKSHPNLFEKCKIVEDEEIPESTSKSQASDEGLENKENGVAIKTNTKEESEELVQETTAMDTMAKSEVSDEEGLEQKDKKKTLGKTAKEESELLVEKHIPIANCCTDETFELTKKKEKEKIHTQPEEDDTIIEVLPKEEPLLDDPKCYTIVINELEAKNEVQEEDPTQGEEGEIVEAIAKEETQFLFLEKPIKFKKSLTLESPVKSDILELALAQKGNNAVKVTATNLECGLLVEEPISIETALVSVVPNKNIAQDEKKIASKVETCYLVKEPIAAAIFSKGVALKSIESDHAIKARQKKNEATFEAVQKEQEPQERIMEKNLQRATKIKELSQCDLSNGIEQSLTNPTHIKIFETSFIDSNQQMMSSKKVSNDTQGTAWVFESEKLCDGNEPGELETPGDLTKQFMPKAVNDKVSTVQDEIQLPVLEIDNNNLCKDLLNASFNRKSEELNPTEVTDSKQFNNEKSENMVSKILKNRNEKLQQIKKKSGKMLNAVCATCLDLFL